MNSFKKTCVTTCLFLLIFGLLSSVMIECYFQSAESFFLDLPQRKACRGTLDTLFVGASECQRAFNPDVIDQDMGVTSYNLGGISLSMRGKYELLKTELQYNPVKTVYLEVAKEALQKGKNWYSAEGDVDLLGRLDNPVQRLTYCLSAVPAKHYGKVYAILLKRGVNSFRKYLTGDLKTENNSMIRGYKPYDENVSTERFQRELATESEVRGHRLEIETQKDAADYLRKTIRLCKENNIRLVMVTVPISEFQLNRFENFDETMEPLRTIAQEEDVEYYDFNLLKGKSELLQDETDYYDREHLLPTGADKFSHRFSELMNQVEQGEDISDLFYASYDERDQAEDPLYTSAQ